MQWDVPWIRNRVLIVLCLFILPGMNPAEAEIQPQLKIYPGHSAVKFTIQADAFCSKREAIAWISTEQTLLFQAEVRPDSDFEVHLVPGKKYEVMITGPSGCIAEKTFEVSSNEIKEYQLNFQVPQETQGNTNRVRKK